MTTYTAADFAVSRFADFDTSDAIAMRSGSGRKPWVIPNGRVLSDARMASDGWVPVREPGDLCISTDKTWPESCEWRPLTPGAIEVALHDCMPGVAFDRLSATQVMRLAEDMHAALTDPPARPEGAKELGELIGTWTATEDIAPAQLPTGSLATLADFLAERGVRVVAEEMNR